MLTAIVICAAGCKNNPQFRVNAIVMPSNAGLVDGTGIYEDGDGCTLIAKANENFVFYYWSEDDEWVSSDSIYYFAVNNNRNMVAHYAVASGDGHAYVDLGLPSGTLWATRNVRASKPEDNGGYFAWGETQIKDSYKWSTYKYSNGGNSPYITKYCTDSGYGYKDNLTLLEPNDDVATAIWGGDWRMPTSEEWTELLNNTTKKYTMENGVQGRFFTAANGVSLFLPDAGYKSWDNWQTYGGFYWSSSLYVDCPYDAWGPVWDDYRMAKEGRYCGRPVRAVRSAPQSLDGDEDTQYYDVTVLANPSYGGAVSGEGSYIHGSTCTLMATANEGYVFKGWGISHGDQITADVNASIDITVDCNCTAIAYFNYIGIADNAPIGAIKGAYTINANGDKVYFSQGNLQYIGSASTPYWRFAENQWGYLGETTNQNSFNTNVDRDLFGWGTSGYHDGSDLNNVNYQPWSTSNTGSFYLNYNDYGYGPSTNMSSLDLIGSSAEYDWGVHNAISNGGNLTRQWRTLTREEWAYVFSMRFTNSSMRYAKARVNGVNGVIILPDSWSSSYYTLKNTNQSAASYNSNVISSSVWKNRLEAHGCAFLPAAGERDGSLLCNEGSDGTYWSASYHRECCARHVSFGDNYLGTGSGIERYYGRSVRLVCDVQ